jgi:hypothetical protein
LQKRIIEPVFGKKILHLEEFENELTVLTDERITLRARRKKIELLRKNLLRQKFPFFIGDRRHFPVVVIIQTRADLVDAKARIATAKKQPSPHEDQGKNGQQNAIDNVDLLFWHSKTTYHETFSSSK